jgi:hypothetical protein
LTITKIHFAYRIDRWDDGNSVMEHVADIDDLTVAKAIYEAACKQWPGANITLRQGVRVIEDSRKARVT